MTYRELLSAVVDPKKIKEEYPCVADSIDELIFFNTCPEIVSGMFGENVHSRSLMQLAGHCPPFINSCEDCLDQRIRHGYVLKNPHRVFYEEALGKTVGGIIKALSNGWNWDGIISSIVKDQNNTMRITDKN